MLLLLLLLLLTLLLLTLVLPLLVWYQVGANEHSTALAEGDSQSDNRRSVRRLQAARCAGHRPEKKLKLKGEPLNLKEMVLLLLLMMMLLLLMLTTKLASSR